VIPRPADFQIASAAMHLLPTVLWTALAVVFWQFLLSERRRLAMHWFLPIICSLFAIHYWLHVVEALAPAGLGGSPSVVARMVPASIDFATVICVPFFIQLLLYDRDEHPSLRFLAINYGLAGVFLAMSLVRLWTGPVTEETLAASRFLTGAYTVAGLALAFVLMCRKVKVRGRWRQGTSLLEFRLADAVVIGVAAVALGAMVILVAGSGSAEPASWAALILHSVVGLTFAVPFAARTLGRVLPLAGRLLVLITMVGLIYAMGQTQAAGATHPDVALLWHGSALLLLVALVPGMGLVGRAIDALIFGRAELRHAELQEVLHEISPELGCFECCRRACAGLARVMDLSGTAVVLADGAGAVAHGDLPLDRLTAAWPREGDGALFGPGLREIDLVDVAEPLRSALMETDVVRILPITGRHRRWGYLLTAERLLARPLGDADEEAIGAFAGQLGLLLDAAEVLAHAVEVERSLAHAEKLAALGELSARIAHEIRNPVTAARSLAQQLAREPEVAFATEHRLILAELERVERQIATLLRFARREEYRLARGDLGELVRATVESLRPALADAGIELALDVEEVLGCFDGDKVRQILINLVENARDALELSENAPRHVWVTLDRRDGVAHLRVADDGPGVADEELGRLFEPFYSRKPQGTGLGLAIVRRTVEAHGGRIVAERRREGGLRFDIDLPLGATPREDHEGIDPGRR
jgi:signal transduction histidine kinase